MRKKKLIVHEKHTGKRSAEEVFAAVILAGKRESLTKTVKNGIILQTKQPQDSLCSGKGEDNGTSEK